MEYPSKSDRVELWKLTFARSSFVQAREACRILLLFQPAGARTILESLSTTAILYYYRPFKQQCRTTKLDKTCVPAEFLDLHDDLEHYRDKVLAHRDLKGPKTPWGSANDVVFDSDGSGFWLLTDSPIMEPEPARRLMVLSEILIAEMDARLMPVVARLLPSGLPPGRHVLNLKGDDIEWLKKEGT